jgi:hypothetical protein
MTTLFENNATLDVIDIRDLANAAVKALSVLRDEDSDADEQKEAADNLNILAEALKDFGNGSHAPYDPDEDIADIDHFYGEDIPELLADIGDNYDVTLVLEDFLPDYLDELAIDFGWVAPDTPAIIRSAINWQIVAEEYQKNCIQFVLDGDVFWINK